MIVVIIYMNVHVYMNNIFTPIEMENLLCCHTMVQWMSLMQNIEGIMLLAVST